MQRVSPFGRIDLSQPSNIVSIKNRQAAPASVKSNSKNFWNGGADTKEKSAREKAEASPFGDTNSDSPVDPASLDDASSERENSVLPPWSSGNCFKPGRTIPSQLWVTKSNRNAINSRTTNAQMVFNPSHLPAPYQYAVHQLGIAFNEGDQSWSASDRLQSLLNTPGFPSNRYVHFEGMMDSGKNQLPLPLYGRIVGDVQVEGSAVPFEHNALTASCEIPGNGKVKVKVKVKVKYKVHLLEVPTLTDSDFSETDVDQSFLQPTVSLLGLPPEVQDWIEQTGNESKSLLTRAFAAQSFVRKHYAYDDSYLERREVRRARGRLPRGKGNHHLTLLHASAEGDILGRGVCYELNVLLVELLRRLEVPALTATGWVLSDGIVDFPDHLFALAMVPSENGRCLLTLDAAATDTGVIRTLGPRKNSHAQPQAGLDHEANRLPPVPQPSGAWDIKSATSQIRVSQDGMSSRSGGTSSSSTTNASSSGSSASSAESQSGGLGTETRSASEQKRRYAQTEIALLREAIRRVCAATGANPPRKMSDDMPKLAVELDLLLGDQMVADTYLQILRGNLRHINSVSPQVQKLVDMQLVQVASVSKYIVKPT